jgi:hypothetical protein
MIGAVKIRKGDTPIHSCVIYLGRPVFAPWSYHQVPHRNSRQDIAFPSFGIHGLHFHVNDTERYETSMSTGLIRLIVK